MKWFDLKWLKQWWPEVVKRKPRVGKPPRVIRSWVLHSRLRDVPTSTKVESPTKSEARSLFKKHLGVKRLGVEYYVEEVKPTGGDGETGNHSHGAGMGTWRCTLRNLLSRLTGS